MVRFNQRVQTYAALIAVPVTLLCDAPWTLAPSALTLVGLGLLGLFPSALATITNVSLVRAAGPTVAALTGYLVPPVAVFLSRVLLGQRLERCGASRSRGSGAGSLPT